MRALRRNKLSATVLMAALCSTGGVARAAMLYTDAFTSGGPYTGSATGTTTGNYSATDQDASVGGTWTASGGTLTYTRTGSDTGYESSTLLTGGSTNATGSNAGLSQFSVSGNLLNVNPTNTQQGLIISGSTSLGGYLLETDK
jgi:hypothetical protein